MTTRKGRRTSRAGARGAAMVEGIIIILGMLMFLGLNMWAYKAYGGKIDQANSTRRDALYHASHNCEEQSPDPDTYTDPSLRDGNTVGASGESVGVGGGDPQVDTAVGSSQSQGQSPTATRSGGMTTADRRGEIIGSAILFNQAGDTGGIVGKKTLAATPLRTKSFVWCNQKRHDGFTGTFTGAFDAARGIVDLFQ